MTVGERAKIDAKIAQLKEIAAKYGGEKTINSIIEQLEEFIELRRNGQIVFLIGENIWKKLKLEIK